MIVDSHLNHDSKGGFGSSFAVEKKKSREIVMSKTETIHLAQSNLLTSAEFLLCCCVNSAGRRGD